MLGEAPNGFTKTAVLDGFDRVHEVRQEVESGRELVTRNFYDANGNLRQTEDAERRTTEFLYDGLNRLREVRDALSQATFFDYDGEGNKIEEVDRRGLPTRYDYDNLGRLIRTEIDQPITGGGPLVTSSITYVDAERERIELDARGNRTRFEMDEQQRVVAITDPDGEIQRFEYDGVNKTAEVDKRGHRTELRYDAINRLTEVRDALGQTITTVYRDAERQVEETDKRGLVKTTQLDALGRLVSVIRSGVLLESHAYDGNNNRTLSTDANGNETEFFYDGANRLIERVDGRGSDEETRTTFLYDDVGNLLEEKDGRDTGMTFDVQNTYDELNRLESTTDAEGNTTRFEYDPEGNRTAVIEPKSLDHRTEFDYGELNELIQVRMPDGGIYNYAYDPNRNRTLQEDGEGNVVEFTYDRLNRVDRMIQDPDGFRYVTDHDYDPNGNETRLTDPKGQVIDFSYDELNRLKKKTYHLTAADFELLTRTHEITYHYDPNDNLERVDELKSSGNDPPAIVSSFKSYDALDRLTRETDAWGRTLTYEYDAQGNRTALIDPDSVRTEYTFDELNRLETLTLEAGTPAAQVVTYDYFPDGLKRLVTNPNGTASTYTYDAADRMTTITHDGPEVIVSAYVYEYDENGNRTQQTETNAGRTETTLYDYDRVNRLTVVTYEAGTANANQVSYTYDLAGNRLTEQTVALETSTLTKDLAYTYDAINRLEAIDDLVGSDDVDYEYDPNGNTTLKTKAGITTEFLYDIRDQLSEVQQGPSVLGRYGFDYDGRRILKIGNDGLRRYTYDEVSVLTEADATNSTVSKYEYGLDQLVSLNNRVDGRSFFHLSALDSVSTLTDSAGSEAISYVYDAWGTLRDSLGSSANRFTFNSLEFDSETNLFYASARFYDPEIGRFLSQDPLLGDLTNVPSLHRYAYAFSNPLRFVDPFGLEAGDWYDPRSYDWGVFTEEFGKGLLSVGGNIVTLGGSGSLQEAFAEGRLDATSSSLEVGGVFAEGVFNTITLGGFKGAVDSVTSGEGTAVGGFFEGVGRTVLPIDEVGTLLDSEASGFEKAQAIATGTVKVATLGILGGQAKAALSATPRLGTAGGVNLLRPKVSTPPRPPTSSAASTGRQSFQSVSRVNARATVHESPTSSVSGARTVARTQQQSAVRARVETNLARARAGNRASNFQKHARREKVRGAINRSAQGRAGSDFSRHVKRERLTLNRGAGRGRENRVGGKLQRRFGRESVQREQFLRTASGKIAKDPVTAKGRRLDFVIIRNGRPQFAVEVTSKTANKFAQLAREQRIRAAGGVFVRDRSTGQLVDVSNILTRLSRRQ